MLAEDDGTCWLAGATLESGHTDEDMPNETVTTEQGEHNDVARENGIRG